MPNDPFELSQYSASFDRVDEFSPDALVFANFQIEFTQVMEHIKARQASVAIGYNVPDFVFEQVENFEATTPAGVSAALTLFQDAITQFVDGEIINTYGKLSNCDTFIGFFNFANGFPIVGLSQILPGDSQSDWTSSPDSGSIQNVVAFTQEAGNVLNEIIFSLNVLEYIHGRMVYAYDLDTTCGEPTPPTPTPTPTPVPTPTPTPPTPTPPTPTPPSPTPPSPTPPTPTPPTPTPPTPTPPTPTPPTPTPPTPTPSPTFSPPTPFPGPAVPPGPGLPTSMNISEIDTTFTDLENNIYGINKDVDGSSIDNI